MNHASSHSSGSCDVVADDCCDVVAGDDDGAGAGAGAGAAGAGAGAGGDDDTNYGNINGGGADDN